MKYFVAGGGKRSERSEDLDGRWQGMWSVHVGAGDGDWLEMARLFHHCLHFLIWAMSVPLFSLARWLYAVFFPFLSLTLFPSVPPPSALFPPRSFSRRRRPPPTPDARRIAHNSARPTSTPPPPCLCNRGSDNTTPPTPLHKSACYPLDGTRLSMDRNVPSRLLSLRHPPPSPPTTTFQL